MSKTHPIVHLSNPAVECMKQSYVMRLFFVLTVCATLVVPAMAEVVPPDFTNGGEPINWKGVKVDPLEKDINLGPTGMSGWIFHKTIDSSMSRQILVTEVDEGSPADGIIQKGDVILGVDGTGNNPEPFTSDARVTLGKAVGEAEARDPAIMKLLFWRAGKTYVASLTLQNLGVYSPTAPYNCAKSMYILEQGLQDVMKTEDRGVWSMNALPLLAADYPDNPANAARQAKAKEWVHELILTQEEIDKRLNGYVSGQSKVGWTRGHELLVLAEYYLKTKDEKVFPSIEAMAVEVCNGQSLLGTMGHQFTNPIANGEFNGPYNIGYGAINSAGVPCYYGILLAKQCGVKRPELEPAIKRATNFFGSFTGYGAIPYGEHLPSRGSHESNGKMGLAALALSVEGSRDDSVKFFSKMAAASASEREVGHCGAYFNYLWAPLGANVGGIEAAAAHFRQISWRLDLNRRWDGGFDYDCWYHYTCGGPTYAGRPFWANIPMLLTYAMPLRQLVMTGKNQDVSYHLSSAEVAETVFADRYDATTRSTTELLSDLGFWSPKIQESAAKELGARKDEHEALVPQLISIAINTNAGEQRVGACFALGEIKDGSATADLAVLLTDDDEKVRWAATYAMRYMPKAEQLKHLETILKAAATTIRPFQPLADRVPMQFAHAQISYLLFYNGNAYGPRGIIAGDQLKGVDRDLLYPAIEAVSQTPLGHARSSLGPTFENLTDEDVLALSGALVETAMVPAPADKMFKSGSRTAALSTLQKHKIKEGVMVSAYLANDLSFGKRPHALDVLAKYAGSAKQVETVSEVIELCRYLQKREPNMSEQAQAVLAAIAADKEPAKLTPLKGINTVSAKDSKLTLPAKSTELLVDSFDYSKGNVIYTWKKVHGAGKVSFSNNSSADAKNTTVQFDEIPGKYLFEVTMSDSRGLSESKGVVGVILYDKNGRLPANKRPVAAKQAVNVPKSTTTPIVLRGADPEKREISYAVTNGPVRGKLSGKPPHLNYTPFYGYSGPDRFIFEVTDSEGETSAAAVDITVSSVDTLQVAVYEPFDYPVGLLNGQSGNSEIGFSDPWDAHKTHTLVEDGSLSYGKLPTVGGKMQPQGGNTWGGARAISPSALKANGLLDDGATLWFSAVVGYGPKYSYKWDRLSFALANNSFHQGNARTPILDDGDLKGEGIGFTMSKHTAHSTGGRVKAAHFRSESADPGNGRPEIHGSWDGMPTMIQEGGYGLVVGRVTWAADPTKSDIIEIFGPMEDLELPENPVSVLEATVDQTTFDTLTFDKSGTCVLDEIRFGPSYQSVLAGTVPMVAKTTKD